MSLIALVSAKGSPGVTIAAIALAATWPEDRRVVVAECDPAGGDLAHRFGLGTEVSLTSFAAASRRGSALLVEHLQTLSGGLQVLTAPVAGDQVAAALTLLGRTSPLTETAKTIDVLVDCGRIDSSSPALPLIAQADLVLVVTRPIVTDVAHVATLLPLLRSKANDIGLIVTGNGSYDASEVATALDVMLVGRLTNDASGAAVLSGDRAPARSLGRSSLLRSARNIASHIAQALPTSTQLPEAS